MVYLSKVGGGNGNAARIDVQNQLLLDTANGAKTIQQNQAFAGAVSATLLDARHVARNDFDTPRCSAASRSERCPAAAIS